VGQAAPEIEGEDLDSKKMKLSDFRGQVVVLDFWGHWCPFCQRAYSYQGNLLRRMAGRPFVLLGVNCDQTKEQAQLVVKNHKITWRSWWDCGPNMDGPIYTRWGVRAVPCTYVIDHAGIVRQRFEGMPDETVLDRAVDEVLAALDNRPAGVPPRWEPASTPFAGLATEVAAGPYRLRLPAGYVTEKTDPKKGEQLFAWKGPVRPGDGTAPRLAVMLRPADPAMKLEEAVEKELAELSFPRQGWSCSIAERGEVKGLVFARVGWSGRDPTTRQQVQGFLYLGLDGKTLIRITARDVQPHALPALTVAEAAALTFHRAGP
jgi:peroxiredoxin